MTDSDLATVLASHKAGNLAEAEEGYRRILAADPANGEAYHWLGVVACQQGAHDLALELIGKARDIRPNDPLLMNNLANVLEKLNRIEAAARVLDVLLEAFPDFPEAHYNRARMLAKCHCTDEAIASYRNAIAWRSDYAEAHYNLADLLAKKGHKAQAAIHLLRCLEIEPGDRLGASLKLAVIGMADMPERASFGFMQTLFNQYAARFDDHLTGQLKYTAPEILAQALADYWPQLPPNPAAIDIGCGTGLAGAPLRHRLSRLDGVDASPNMIAEARKRGIYDDLSVADLLAWAECGDADYHLAIAADVVVYFGDLKPLFAGIARRLIDGGLFAFTAERATGRAIHLQGCLRYAHAPQYLYDALAASGFTVLAIHETSTRYEAEQPAPGSLVIARRTLSGVS